MLPRQSKRVNPPALSTPVSNEQVKVLQNLQTDIAKMWYVMHGESKKDQESSDKGEGFKGSARERATALFSAISTLHPVYTRNLLRVRATPGQQHGFKE